MYVRLVLFLCIGLMCTQHAMEHDSSDATKSDLLLAIKNRHNDTVQRLLQDGAIEIFHKNTSWIQLLTMAKNENFEALRLLIQKVIVPGTITSGAHYAIMQAYREGLARFVRNNITPQLAKKLLLAGVDYAPLLSKLKSSIPRHVYKLLFEGPPEDANSQSLIIQNSAYDDSSYEDVKSFFMLAFAQQKSDILEEFLGTKTGEDFLLQCQAEIIDFIRTLVGDPKRVRSELEQSKYLPMWEKQEKHIMSILCKNGVLLSVGCGLPKWLKF